MSKMALAVERSWTRDCSAPGLPNVCGYFLGERWLVIMVLLPSPSRKLSMASISLTMAPKTTLTVVFWLEVIFVV